MKRATLIASGASTDPIPAPVSEAEVIKRALKAAEAALEMAQDCINAETPEDVTFGEAEDSTLSDIREALRLIPDAIRALATPIGK